MEALIFPLLLALGLACYLGQRIIYKLLLRFSSRFWHWDTHRLMLKMLREDPERFQQMSDEAHKKRRELFKKRLVALKRNDDAEYYRLRGKEERYGAWVRR